MSELKCGLQSFPAFSGLGSHINKRMSVCIEGFGAIPPGTYYIVDRPTGGRAGSIRNWLSGKEEWFALFAADGKIDDETTYCDREIRKNFRLHPKGSLGISKGCIVIDEPHRFAQLRGLLKSASSYQIPDTNINAYGRVIVK